MGLGDAMLADYTTLTRDVLRAVSPYSVYQMELLSHIVAVGLRLLWISGIALIVIDTQANPEYITNQKIWAKVIIVCALTLHGVYIHRTILPSLRQAAGRRLFDEIAHRHVAIMTLFGSISFVSWTVPFVLAKASSLNYVTPVQDILAMYVVLVLAVWFAMFTVMSAILSAQSYTRNAAALSSPTRLSDDGLFNTPARRDMLILSFMGSSLLFAWTMVFVLARANEFQSMPPLQNIAALYGCCLLVGLVTFTLLGSVTKVRPLVRKIAALTLLPNAPWETHAQSARRGGRVVTT